MFWLANAGIFAVNAMVLGIDGSRLGAAMGAVATVAAVVTGAVFPSRKFRADRRSPGN